MSGHSKWSTIKGKKGAADAKRGMLFSKLTKEITVAAKNGGGNTETNIRLRTAIQRAREQNMPGDNVERAIKKGTGELPGIVYEEITYEAYGPNGVAIIVETLTDNRNRTTAEIRNIFTRRGGNIAGSGAVSWMFSKKGFIVINKKKADEEKLMTIALDAGAEDMKSEPDGDSYEVTTSIQDFEKVRKALIDNKIEPDSAEITMLPANLIKMDYNGAKQILGLVDELEDHEDVQNVYANFDIPDKVMQEIEKG